MYDCFICDQFSLPSIIIICEFGMSGRSVGFDRGICSGLFMEEKMSGQGEICEVQTNL